MNNYFIADHRYSFFNVITKNPVFFGEGASRRLAAVIVAVTRDEEALVVPVDDWMRGQLTRP